MLNLTPLLLLLLATCISTPAKADQANPAPATTTTSQLANFNLRNAAHTITDAPPSPSDIDPNDHLELFLRARHTTSLQDSYIYCAPQQTSCPRGGGCCPRGNACGFRTVAGKVMGICESETCPSGAARCSAQNGAFTACCPQAGLTCGSDGTCTLPPQGTRTPLSNQPVGGGGGGGGGAAPTGNGNGGGSGGGSGGNGGNAGGGSGGGGGGNGGGNAAAAGPAAGVMLVDGTNVGVGMVVSALAVAVGAVFL